MLKKYLIFIFFCCFLTSCKKITLEEELSSYFVSHCKEQMECIVDLHKALPFQWDKAYFFEKSNQKYIQKITGITGNFKTDVGTQVVFIKNNKVVAYQEFFTVNDLTPQWDIKSKYIDIAFTIKNVFNSNIYIDYYYITSSNDKIMVKFNLSHPKGVIQKSYTIYPTDLNQVKLFNPKTDSN